MIRGELWTVSGGVYASKPRPALIFQDDAFTATASVTVLPLTSSLIDTPLLRVRVLAGELSGLARDSDVMIDKITTVRRSNLAERVGRVSAEQLAEIERGVMAFLGLAR
ncbi:type II toxin-antitoxin system PemK/MazF family toxin [Tessaracoccus palaemonis]|uniref:Type II toxin-antitoxin system PemK/MazF family toxin n=1 Tax=Tessaracoccus palaemonis TaxID=2829499 RepID=A0ABX8SG77_9ACTN|nr:type II toxin-antitoxin system PemK/MazF family toxin [Tessaracoccus palaemonis]QXT62361.1 type II toxin-antitoxin system PemK/MazF family toxin [Tessaracoccus palaemonis]